LLYFGKGSTTTAFTEEALREALAAAFTQLGPRKRVLAIPPDHTRIHGRTGLLTRMAWEHYGEALTDVLPALGTHAPMGETELQAMFGDMPRNLFRVHDWRHDVVTLGEVPASFVREVSEGRVAYPWKAQVNRLLVEGGHDLILSLGQIVPHEVVGMAGHAKNIFVGTGGSEGIHKSHFLGAAYGMERIMGRADTPVRRVLDYAAERFASHLPIVHVLTVMGKDEQGDLVMRGLFIGDDRECFLRAAELSLQVNFQMLEAPLRKVVVYLDPLEYRSTWLGNKAIYRTRMALADDGELIILAPGVEAFGEDPRIDALIREFGYVGTPRVLEQVQRSEDLQRNLSAAAHLIHGSSEGRFRITYAPGHLTPREIEAVGFSYRDPAEATQRYDPAALKDGFNELPDGEQIFYISNPALGLWAHRDRFS
jgi:nickel-dependent lactate racemase